MSKTNYFGKALAIAMMLLGLTFVSCDEQDNPIPSAWDGVSPNLPLTLETVAEDGTMNVTFTSTLPDVTTIEYSIDGGKSWRVFTISGGKPYYVNSDWTVPYNAIPYSRTISSVHQILIKGQNETYGSTYKGDLELAEDEIGYMPVRYLHISVNADCYIYGNMMSLVGGDDFATRTDLKEDNTFYCMFVNDTNLKSHSSKKLLMPATTLTKECYTTMFANCTALTTAPDLPATTLPEACYQGLFGGCTALTSAPKISATTVGKFSCEQMFFGCTSLTVAPELPATTIGKFGYREMFIGCTALTTPPSELPATVMSDSCCFNMFNNCKALTKAPKLPATTLAGGCYQQMFLGCSALTAAPELPAKTMVKNCYDSMFRSCSALTTAPELPATTLAEECYSNMFNTCTALTTAPEQLPATTLAESCYKAMFGNCAALIKAPVLPAKELKNECYMFMFDGCTNLNYIKCLATSIDASVTSSPTAGWIDGIAANGTFVKDASVEYGAGKFWVPGGSGWPIGQNPAPSTPAWTISDSE